ncbi:kinesin-like protein, partial [Elysia marginata]
VKVLTEEWAEKWNESASLLQEKNLALRQEGLGVVLDSTLPHLIGIDDDVLSTGIKLFHLREGITKLGSAESDEPQDISK